MLHSFRCLHFFLPVGPYKTTTANVSAVFDTQITPSGWTFNIWSVIYVWLTMMMIYILSTLCRKLVPVLFLHLDFKRLKSRLIICGCLSTQEWLWLCLLQASSSALWILH